MPLQDIKIQTVFELEKVFDLLNQIVTENVKLTSKAYTFSAKTLTVLYIDR